MDSTALHNLFRAETRDEVVPYLWSSAEIYANMDDAQKMFCRLQGGISDTTGAVTQLAAVANQAYTAISPRVLKIRQLVRADGRFIELLNFEDLTKLDTLPGPISAAVSGMEMNKLRWVPIPAESQTVAMWVYRMPLNDITTWGQALEIDEHHHRHLLLWMKHLAHLKQDAETYDRGRAEMFRSEFEAYCLRAKAERELREHKYRTVAYGGC
jgi:hypothetical protein